MKYAIYDKAANGYLTKMVFEVGYSEHTQFECGLNEYITKAQLLDTKKAATDAVTRIESTKFMNKGQFVIHSFDDTLNDQYIISEAGNPTKVVDNITVDLDGTVNVKYGTMVCHWHTTSLEHAINRMNALQKAVSAIYTPWNNTFMVYKVITIMDEKEHTHYQFINRTITGLVKAEHDEEEKLLVAGKEITDIIYPLNKRIEELEKANYDLGEQLAERGTVANCLLDENNSLKTKVESIKKEAHDWKKRYENANTKLNALKNVIDNVYDDLHSDDICKDLKDTYDYVHNLSELHNIKIHNDNDDTGMPIYITANVEFRCIIDKIIAIIESRELNQSVAFASADEVHNARGVAYDIISICEKDCTFETTLKKFSELYEAVNAVYNTKDDPIMHAFNSVLLIFSTMDSKLENFADEIVSWKNKARKAEKALDDQKKLNDANKATIAYLTVEKMAKDKELSDLKWRVSEAEKSLNNQLELNHGVCDENHELRVARDCSAEIIYAIRNAIVNGNADTFDCIESRMRHESDFNSDPFMAGVRENVKDICFHEKINITNNDLKNSEIARLAEERDKALEQKEFYKRQANSVYGMTIPSRCCGKQLTADILSGKKIPISKKKYDDLVEYVNNINLTFDTIYSMRDMPIYLSTLVSEKVFIINECLKDLTK